MGSGKKNTKIYKAEHIPTGKIYAIKEVEAKTLEKLNEYKVRRPDTYIHYRKRQCSYLRYRAIRMSSSSTATTSMRPCTTHSG